MSEQQPLYGGIQIVDPNDKGLPADLIFSAMSNKTLADELRRVAISVVKVFPLNSKEFNVIKEAEERIRSWS